MRNPAVYTFWLGVAGETAKPPARDLRDLTSAEFVIYQQAYAEGYATARGVARDWGTSGSADVMQAAQRPSGLWARIAAHPLEYPSLTSRGDR